MAKQMSENNETTNTSQACEYAKNLFSNQKKRANMEKLNWLTEQDDKLPLWSRLKPTNCTGQARGVKFGKKQTFEIEIPDLLLSLFGTSAQAKHINSMENKKNYQLLSNIFALCAAVKYHFREWSENLLDEITEAAAQQYPKLLKKLTLADKQIKINHLSQTYKFNGMDFEVKLQEILTGYLYLPDGLVELNLAKALTCFFSYHKLGLIKCCNRVLAFGYVPAKNFGYFMYDCQSQGHPIFVDQQASCSYILRAHNVQILLYCLIITLNASTDMAQFIIYNIDIQFYNPLTKKGALKDKTHAKQNLDDSEIPQDSSSRKGKIKSNRMENSYLQVINIIDENKTNENKKNIMRIQYSSNIPQIILNNDSTYYIIAVAKHQSKATAANLGIKEKSSKEVDKDLAKNNENLINTSKSEVADEQDNTNTAKENVTESTKTLDFEVLVIENHTDLRKKISDTKILIASELKNIFQGIQINTQ